MKPVTDPALLAQLDGDATQAPPAAQPRPVTDSKLLAQLDGTPARGMDWAAPLDLAATGLSKVAVGLTEPLVGLGSRALLRDYRADKKAFRDTFAYQPQTEGARETIKAAGDFFRPVTEPIGNAVGAATRTIDQKIGEYAGPEAQRYAREFMNAGMDVVGALPAAAAVAKGGSQILANRAAAKQAAQVARAPDEVAKALGLKVSPHSVKQTTGTASNPNIAARVTDAVAGERSNILHQRFNRQQVNNVAAQEIGLPPKSPINRETLSRAAKPHAAVYDEVRTTLSSPIPFDRQVATDIGRAGRGTDSTLRLPAGAEKVIEDVSRPMTGSQLIDTISDLRISGYKGLNAIDNVDAQALGSAKLDIANALERHMDRALSRAAPDLVGRYQGARRGFARIHAVESAMVGNDVDAMALARMAKKSNALDGSLRAIGETATHFPDEFSLGKSRINDVSPLGFQTLALPIRHAAGKMVSWTRGQARNPVVGPKGRLSYYYRDNGPSGLIPRGPITSPERLLPGISDTAIPMGGPGAPKWPPRPTRAGQQRMLPPPGRSSYGNPNAAASGSPEALGMGPDVSLAGTRHPGGTPLAGHAPPMSLSDSLEAYVARQRGDGINFENVLIEPTKRRIFPTVAGKRQRGIAQGEKVGNRVNVNAAAGAKERGMALELALQGKKVPKASKTSIARAIAKDSAKGKK